MTAATFEKKIRELLQRQPFQPFIIKRDDGVQFVVGQPESLWHHQGGSAVYFHADGSLDFVHSEVVTQIVELVPSSATT